MFLKRNNQSCIKSHYKLYLIGECNSLVTIQKKAFKSPFENLYRITLYNII